MISITKPRSRILPNLPYNRVLRRILSIAMLVMLGAQLLGSFVAVSASVEANLPACCRRDGKHHCGMSAMQRSAALTGMGTRVSAVGEKCPYYPKAMAGALHLPFAPERSAAIFAGICAHPTVSPQTSARYRISFSRSRQKRGPPVSLL